MIKYWGLNLLLNDFISFCSKENSISDFVVKVNDKITLSLSLTFKGW